MCDVQELVMKLANAAADLIADFSTPQDFLIYFGRSFIRAAGPFKYDTLIKVIERYFMLVLIRLSQVQRKLHVLGYTRIIFLKIPDVRG